MFNCEFMFSDAGRDFLLAFVDAVDSPCEAASSGGPSSVSRPTKGKNDSIIATKEKQIVCIESSSRIISHARCVIEAEVWH